MAEEKISAKLDLRGVLCPLNFVKTKLRLEEMEPGELLEVTLGDVDGVSSVPRSLKDQGHQIVSLIKVDNAFRLVVKRGPQG